MEKNRIDADTLVIGAGLIGSSVAMHLAQLGNRSVHVIDFDLEGTFSSSELNAGGVRGTWAQPLNIELSKCSIEYYASVAERVGYRPCGYLWLHNERTIGAAEKAAELQNQLGWEVETLSPKEITERVPFIDKTDDLKGAIFGKRDGLLNPNSLKVHYREVAKEFGVKFDDRTTVVACEKSENGFRVTCERYILKNISSETLQALLEGNANHSDLEKIEVNYHVSKVINCAGSWSASVAKTLGYECPSFPVRRQVSIFDCKKVDLTKYGMIVDTSGVYFHPEATNGLAGYADPNEPRGVNFHYDGQSFFEEKIWLPLYERSTYFEALKHLTGWAGLYEVSPDESAIVGKVDGKDGMFECHSFSGHGAMHSYAAGLCLAELIEKGNFSTIDISPLSATRFKSGKLLKEGLVI